MPETQTFLEGLIQGMRCGILAIDSRGRLILLNELARKILDLPEIPAVGTPLAAALARQPQLVQALLGSFGMASLPNRAELDLQPGPGGPKTVGFTLSMIRTAGGEPCGAAMFFKDLTQIECTEEQERLKDRLAALGQMAASLAHEMRNPLASIEVSCKLIERRLGDERACRELLSRIVAEVHRLNQSIGSSLDYVRPVTPSLEPASLTLLLDEAIGVARGRRDSPAVEIVRRYAPEVPQFLMDRELLRQVFVNLILNALEAVGERGTVRVEAELVEAPAEASVPYRPPGAAAAESWPDVKHFVVVRVADDGPGIREADRDRIFHPFFTTKANGSGVGLATAKKIVGSHRGLIDVDSRPGEGTQFLVRLPLVQE
jgi:two-component system nitrogen regulation sensor histidine kinase GlnL